MTAVRGPIIITGAVSESIARAARRAILAIRAVGLAVMPAGASIEFVELTSRRRGLTRDGRFCRSCGGAPGAEPPNGCTCSRSK